MTQKKKEKARPETAKPGVTELPKAAKKKPTEEEVLNLMVKLKANGVAETTTSLFVEKLSLDKESGRDQIRRLMRKLEADGKVVISRKEQGKRKQYVFKLKEAK